MPGRRRLLAWTCAALTTEPFSKELDAAIHSVPRPPEADYLRGMFALSEGKAADAARDFESALLLAPNDPRFLRASLALRLERSGGILDGQELVEVRAAVEKLEQLASSPSELLLVARFFAATGEEQRALSLGTQAMALSPVDPLVLSEYARVLESCGHLEEAVATQQHAIEFLYEQRDLQKVFRDELRRMKSLASEQKRRAAVSPPSGADPGLLTNVSDSQAPRK